MSVDLYRLDSIKDYDRAIDALEDYVADLVEEFVEAPEGKAYLKAHPEMQEYVGSWIDQLLYFGYAYESVTLPHMTRDDLEVVVTELFPRKVSLLNPDEADTTIPELIAFWQFLKRAYKHPSASRILTFLKKIQPKFKGMINDSSKFGMAKSFFMAGSEAGFDMTTEKGLKAFQEQYNQKLQKSTANPSIPPGLEMLLGNLNPQAGNPPDAIPAQAQLKNLLTSLLGAMSQEESLFEELAPEEDFEQQLRASMWQSVAEELPPLSEEAIALLKQQKISETQPGTILPDFQTLLDFVGEGGIAVSGKHHLLPLKFLPDLNQRLSEPIQLDLKRPQQKSYPPINGLYLLLRASGLGQIVSQGKKKFLVLNPELLRSWNNLNPTERYCTLLEAWLVRGHEEMLGERRSPLNAGTKCLQYWPRIPSKGQKISSYGEQQLLSYCPELHNLALMKLFGLLQVEAGKPEVGKGWRVKRIKKLPFDDALMHVIVRAFTEHGMVWESEDDPTISFGELQPALQSYFPEWQNTLAIASHEFRAGVYVFKVSLGKIWRRIAISSDSTLADLSATILQSVDFDSDHLDMFRYKNQVGRTVEVSHPYADGSPSTDEVRIGDLPLAEGASMTYIFDFGDWWEFDVQLEKVETDKARRNYQATIESYGAAPSQYPDWDDM